MYFCMFAYFFSVLFTSFWSELFKRQSFCPSKKVELMVMKWSYFVGGLFCLVFLTFIYYILNTPLDMSSSEVQFFGFMAGVAVSVFILCMVSTFNIHFEKSWKWEDFTLLNIINFFEGFWSWLKKEVVQLLNKMGRKKD